MAYQVIFMQVLLLACVCAHAIMKVVNRLFVRPSYKAIFG
jgi:hypothetical protein